ncbi:muscarinic acetylcholine receptor M3-like [Pecten maximus]|uniref:muscarinic acetylcholine receptor M3-like n=1 Tax=Pecten maximus TaxID=6579 RepID=UPI0014580C19|nr:muscarinic acetylcholine receptor M3-like [Pecten maximus]
MAASLDTYNVTSMANDDFAIPWERIVIGISMYIIILITIFGNVLVLTAVAKNKNLQTVFNFYVINLAVTDTLVAVTAMISYTTEIILGYWPFGKFWCGVWIFFDYGMTFASVFTLLIISIDRFWSVTWTVHYRVHHNTNKCVRLIIAVWVVMVVLWLPPCILDRMNNSVPYQCVWDPSKNKEFVIVIATIGHHGSFVVMMLCYIRVFLVVLNRKRVGNVYQHSKQEIVKKTTNLVKIYAKSDTDINISEPPAGKGIKSSSVEEVGDNKIGPEVTTNPTFPWRSDPYLRPDSYKTLLKVNDKKMFVSNVTITTAASGALDTDLDTSDGSCKAYQERPQTRDRGHSKKRKQKEDRKYERNERKVFKTLTYILVGYVICWLPFHLVFDVRCALPEAVPPLVYNITFWLSYMNSTINPFLYNFSSAEFRAASKALLFRKSRT